MEVLKRVQEYNVAKTEYEDFANQLKEKQYKNVKITDSEQQRLNLLLKRKYELETFAFNISINALITEIATLLQISKEEIVLKGSTTYKFISSVNYSTKEMVELLEENNHKFFNREKYKLQINIFGNNNVVGPNRIFFNYNLESELDPNLKLTDGSILASHLVAKNNKADRKSMFVVNLSVKDGIDKMVVPVTVGDLSKEDQRGWMPASLFKLAVSQVVNKQKNKNI